MPETLTAATVANLREVLAAKHLLPGDADMDGADLKTALAAVRGQVPAITAGSLRFLSLCPQDLVSPISFPAPITALIPDLAPDSPSLMT